jgi:hypothetical protein
MKSFKEWVAEKDGNKNEVSTSTGDVASFKARLPIGTVSREWPPKEVLNMTDDLSKCKKCKK